MNPKDHNGRVIGEVHVSERDGRRAECPRRYDMVTLGIKLKDKEGLQPFTDFVIQELDENGVYVNDEVAMKNIYERPEPNRTKNAEKAASTRKARPEVNSNLLTLSDASRVCATQERKGTLEESAVNDLTELMFATMKAMGVTREQVTNFVKETFPRPVNV